jgi:hypothetical protein
MRYLFRCQDMQSKPTQPTQPPSDSRKHLLASINAIVDGKEKPRKEHKIIYRISGGPPTRRLEQILEIQGTGSINCYLMDQLKGQKRMQRFKQKLAPDKVIGIFKELLESRLLENIETDKGFLPDSIIGSITIEHGISRITYYFLADEQQQQNQGKSINPSLARMNAILQELYNQVLGLKNQTNSTQKPNYQERDE